MFLRNILKVIIKIISFSDETSRQNIVSLLEVFFLVAAMNSILSPETLSPINAPKGPGSSC